MNRNDMNRRAVAKGGAGSAAPGGKGNGRRSRDGGNGNGNSSNWFIRHKLVTIVMLSLLICLLAGTGIVMHALNDPLRVLQNRTTSPTPDAVETDGLVTPEDTIMPTDTDAPEPTPTEELPPDYEFDKDTVNFIILGTDSNQSRLKKGKNARTDMLMLLSVNVRTKSASMISIPRDTYVKIYNQNNKVYTKNRINAAFTFGGGLSKNGIAYAMNTMNHFLANGKLPIDHYVLFDMDFVRKLIDAVGGVTVDVDFTAVEGGIQFTEGIMRLNGKQALTYARDRHHTAGGDVGRGGHQQDVMIALLKELQDKGKIWQSVPELYDAFSQNLTTSLDDPMQLLALAWIAKDIKISDVKQYTLKGSSLSIAGASILVADQGEKQRVIEEVFGITVPIDSTWTYSKLKGEIEAVLSAGKADIAASQSLLDNNKAYYTDEEASDLRVAIAAWQAASQKNDSDKMNDAIQDVKNFYKMLKELIDARRAAEAPSPSPTPAESAPGEPTATPPVVETATPPVSTAAEPTAATVDALSM